MREFIDRVWKKWLEIGRFIGDWIARIVLTLSYFTLFAPFAMGVRLFVDPLDIKLRNHPRWIDRTTQDLSVDDALRLS